MRVEGGFYRSLVGVVGSHCSGGRGGLGGELAGGDALVAAGAYLLRDEDGVAELLEPRYDLIELDGLLPQILAGLCCPGWPSVKQHGIRRIMAGDR
jgi:hypothetical protein